jgi:hypothetical protein
LKLTIQCDKQKLPTKLRPKEISEWIKSKKKDSVPSLKPGEYGNRFMGWWEKMQPSWRTTGLQAGRTLFRDVPTGETWEVLKKGGTAGIYIVVMGLSWWVIAQRAEIDVNAWSVVDDLMWVIQEMKADRGSPALKRAHDEEDKEGQRAKR